MMSSKIFQNKCMFILSLALVIFFNSQSIAHSIDPPLMEWMWPDDQSYQTNIVATSMDQSIDGGYVVAGYSNNPMTNTYNFQLIKINSSGIVEWDIIYDTVNDWEKAYAVSKTTDGGYIIAGQLCKSYLEDAVIYLVKVNSNGTKQWDSKLSGALGDYGGEYSVTDVFQVDGGYIVGGSKYFSGTETTDARWPMFLLKANSLGQFVWEKEIGEDPSLIYDDYEARSVIQTEAGGFALAGLRYVSPEFDACLILTDAWGNEIDRRLYGEKDVDEVFYSIDQTSDTGFILGGGKGPGDGAYSPQTSFVLKLNSSFLEEWYKEIPEEYDTYGNWTTTVKQTYYGEYIVGRYGDTHQVMKLNKSGEEKWSRSFDWQSWISSIQQTEDLGYIILGNINWAGPTKSRLVKLEGYPCEGDFEPDGDVDGSDLAVFAADFGRTDCGSGPTCKGDFDDDGDVDGSDLAIFAADFGRTDCP